MLLRFLRRLFCFLSIHYICIYSRLAGLVPALKRVIQEQPRELVKEALWAAGNIFSGSAAQRQAAFGCGLVHAVADRLEDAQPALSREAIIGIHNFVSLGDLEHIAALFSDGSVARKLMLQFRSRLQAAPGRDRQGKQKRGLSVPVTLNSL